jgi:hypothetical protein
MMTAAQHARKRILWKYNSEMTSLSGFCLFVSREDEIAAGSVLLEDFPSASLPAI